MQQGLWKRLSDSGDRLRFRTHQVISIRGYLHETDSELDARIERWKAGEQVDGIDGIYEGGDITVVGVIGVSPHSRN